MARPVAPSADRQQVRLFCQLLAADAAGRKVYRGGWYVSLEMIARRLGVPADQIERLADRCAALGLVHRNPHSAALTDAGTALAAEPDPPPRRKGPAKRRKRPA
jgi:hypothetical protein